MSDWYDLDHNVISIEEAEELLRDGQQRQVTLWKHKDWTVSTVFLVLDHQFGDGPPLLYETMVFDPDGEAHMMDRYHTRTQAVAGHDQMVAMVRDLIEEKARE